MLIFKEFGNRLHYYLDSLKASSLKATIDHFTFDPEHNCVVVSYRLGRQKLLNKMDILQFEQEYFTKISPFDRHRLTKFSALQHVLQELFGTSVCDKETLINYIQREVKNEQLL